MMSEAEEMLLSTRANEDIGKKRRLSEDVVADVEANATIVQSTTSQNVPLPAPAPANTAASTPSHGAPSDTQTVTRQRHTRASTSDSRKGDHRVSSGIVAMSSISVSPCLQWLCTPLHDPQLCCSHLTLPIDSIG